MDSQPAPPEVEARKPCVACGERIPARATICSHCQQRQTPDKTSPMKLILGWVGGISAILGLGATLVGGYHSFSAARAQRAAIKSELALAATQLDQSEYETALHTYTDILQKDPRNGAAADGQRKALFRWDEYFSVSAPEGQDFSAIAAPKIDQLFNQLDIQRSHAQGTVLADVEAHIGWTHWLNRMIAFREFGDAPEKNLRDALAIDPNNVYANAMLANILIKLHEDLPQAQPYMAAALASGKERVLVRRLQIGALLMRTGMSGSCAEFVRVANQMGLGNEAMESDDKRRIVSRCFSIYNSHKELTEVLSAVPPDQVWASYQWLIQNDPDRPAHSLDSDFISASLLEASGKPAEALAKFRDLQRRLEPDTGFSFRAQIEEAVKRLAHPAPK